MASAAVKFCQVVFKKKPIEVIEAEENSNEIDRHLTLFDCIMIGIGTTVGTGIFAGTASIISKDAGPAAAISWLLGGLGCILSGIAYMELSSKIPSAGSCYAYSYHALGELAAVIAAWLLTFEYGLAGAGVARSWAEKVQEMLEDFLSTEKSHFSYLNAKHSNLLAAGIHVIAVAILLMGLRLGKKFVNVMTMMKIMVLMFMIIVGFIAMTPSNLDPFIPPRQNGKFGTSGVMLGASHAFFGYIGFDEVCCLAAEAKNPRRTLPLSVLGVVLGTCFLSCLCSLALAGMQSYTEVESYASAFGVAGYHWAKVITRVGEVLTMPVVVLISFLAQPRLQYAMAMDGLLPPIFKELNDKGEIFWGTFISGAVFTVVALVTPFPMLWEMVNFGILISFNMTNCSLVIVRTSKNSPQLAPILQGMYVVFSGTAIFIWQKCLLDSTSSPLPVAVAVVLASILSVAAVVSVTLLYMKCPQEENETLFAAPFVPFTPAIAIAFNWYLVSQLTFEVIGYGFCWILCAIISYFCYGYSHSVGRNNWKELLEGHGAHGRPSSIYYPRKSQDKEKALQYNAATTPTKANC